MVQRRRSRATAPPPLDHVRIGDYSDRELLGIMADLGGLDIATRDVALRISGLPELEDNEPEIRHWTKCVGSRFSWMRRYGLVEKAEEKGEWSISETGERLRRAKLGAVATRIAQADDIAALQLANVVGEKLVVAGMVEGRAMQRELIFQINRRKQQPWYR